jgi:outer membrane protein assembly factor BamD
MKLIIKISKVLFVLILLQSCATEKKEVSLIQEKDQEKEMILSYKQGIDNLEKGDTFYAAKKFLEAELMFPQSEWASKSALMAAYSYYLQDYYSEALFNLERFLNTYRGDKKKESYAHYLMAMCYYELIVDEKKDLSSLINAKEKFNYVIDNFSESDFAEDSKYKIDLINDILASKEMYIGRHYIKKQKWIAAINRFKVVTKDYETTVYIEEAIHRLVEIYYYLGLIEESQKYASLLGYNYASSQWYDATYKIFNKNYEKRKIIKATKKEKKGLFEKFKKLFQ